MTSRDAKAFSIGALAVACVFVLAEAATVWWFENRYSLGMP